VESHLKEKEFVVVLGNDSRIRHYHNRIRKEILEFRVQLEIQVKGGWKPIVRYDTAHGFAHRDTYHADGRVGKTPLPFGDCNSLLTFAEDDLHTNWELYRERFLKEADSND
jgi:hypothetical protein